MTTITGAFAALNGIKALKQKRVGVRPLQSYMTNVAASG
jgi:carbamoyl-phosphate synthase large subunit